MPIIVKRLGPDKDIYSELKALVDEYKIEAAVILSLVGSVKEGSLRFANQEQASLISGPLEIVSATGTLGLSGMHIHASLADSRGRTYGGHFMPGNKVYTTCEIVIHDFSREWKFERVLDVSTGYPELVGIQLHLK